MNEDDELLKTAVVLWWNEVSNDKGGLSKLRRQSDILGIEGISCFYDLAKALPNEEIDVLAAIAMAVSHVKTNTRTTLAKNMGKIKNGRVFVSEIRLNRLMDLSREELTRELIRILPLVDSAANIERLALDIKYWEFEKQISKKQWLNDYYLANKKV